ncbi:MAG: hypothetical protein K2X29_08590, partial [Candidatus Obscuribacterales bacterium]|nr:hypothetical protein [Candidatus Obscuribacterales bacterium]
KVYHPAAGTESPLAPRYPPQEVMRKMKGIAYIAKKGSTEPFLAYLLSLLFSCMCNTEPEMHQA